MHDRRLSGGVLDGGDRRRSAAMVMVGPERSLILDDYRIVEHGRVRAGDRVWSTRLLAWVPVTVNDQRKVSEFDGVIRRKNGD